MSQQLIGTEVKINAGETAKIGRLEVNYIGILSAEKRLQNLELNQADSESFFFQIKDNKIDGTKIYKRKGSYVLYADDLVIRIIKEKSDSSAVTIMVITKDMERRLNEKAITEFVESYNRMKTSIEKMGSLLNDSISNTIKCNLNKSDDIMYFTFLVHDATTKKDIPILQAKDTTACVWLNGMWLTDDNETGKYHIKPASLGKSNALRVYYKGAVYTSKFKVEIDLDNRQYSYSFILKIEKGKKIRWKIKR